MLLDLLLVSLLPGAYSSMDSVWLLGKGIASMTLGNCWDKNQLQGLQTAGLLPGMQKNMVPAGSLDKFPTGHWTDL